MDAGGLDELMAASNPASWGWEEWNGCDQLVSGGKGRRKRVRIEKWTQESFWKVHLNFLPSS